MKESSNNSKLRIPAIRLFVNIQNITAHTAESPAIASGRLLFSFFMLRSILFIKLLFSFVMLNGIITQKGREQGEFDEQHTFAALKRKASPEITCAGSIYDL